MAFEIGRQYELTVKEVTGGKKNQYTLQVCEAKDRKHSFSIPVDAAQLKKPVNALKHKKVVADCVEIDGKARLRLAKEFYKDAEPAASQTAKETPLAAQEAPKPTAELSAGEGIEHRVLKEHGFRSCLFPSTETGCIVKIYFAAGVAAMRKPTVL